MFPSEGKGASLAEVRAFKTGMVTWFGGHPGSETTRGCRLPRKCNYPMKRNESCPGLSFPQRHPKSRVGPILTGGRSKIRSISQKASSARMWAYKASVVFLVRCRGARLMASMGAPASIAAWANVARNISRPRKVYARTGE